MSVGAQLFCPLEVFGEAKEVSGEQDADPATRSRDGSGHSTAQGNWKVMV